MAILKCDIGLIQLEECPRCKYLVSWVDMKYENEKPVLCRWCAAEQSVHPTVATVAAQEVKLDARNSGLRKPLAACPA